MNSQPEETQFDPQIPIDTDKYYKGEVPNFHKIRSEVPANKLINAANGTVADLTELAHLTYFDLSGEQKIFVRRVLDLYVRSRIIEWTLLEELPPEPSVHYGIETAYKWIKAYMSFELGNPLALNEMLTEDYEYYLLIVSSELKDGQQNAVLKEAISGKKITYRELPAIREFNNETADNYAPRIVGLGFLKNCLLGFINDKINDGNYDENFAINPNYASWRNNLKEL